MGGIRATVDVRFMAVIGLAKAQAQARARAHLLDDAINELHGALHVQSVHGLDDLLEELALYDS